MTKKKKNPKARVIGVKGQDDRINGGWGAKQPTKAIGGKTNFSQQFLDDFLTHWNQPHKNEKGMLEKDDQTGETIYSSKGQRALEMMYRKAPAQYVKTGQAVFANITPKVHTKEVGVNLASLIRDLNEQDARNGYNIIEGTYSDAEAPALEDKSIHIRDGHSEGDS